MVSKWQPLEQPVSHRERLRGKADERIDGSGRRATVRTDDRDTAPANPRRGGDPPGTAGRRIPLVCSGFSVRVGVSVDPGQAARQSRATYFTPEQSGGPHPKG
ncbi:hypothetical protein, partial [Nocardia abscessus]|uniref:hypothetical protein n=1 Tax=Nocardia abscessus TaxID=120957 RepID=UPI0024571655